MTFVRPEFSAMVWRWREVIFAAALVGFGLWLVLLGGWILVPIGLLILTLAAMLARQAMARTRFQQAVGAPGLVELDEAQLAYLGPEVGGYISLDEAVELRIVSMRGRRLWRVRQADGQAMLIPIDAEGAGQLFDAFAGLPGMDVTALANAATGLRKPAGGGQPALVPSLAETHVIWRREAKANLAPR